MPKGPLRQFEQEYIAENCLDMTDASIAKHLNRDVRTVAKYRKEELGIQKGRGGKLSGSKKHQVYQIQELTQDIPLSQKGTKEYFKLQLKNSKYYKELEKQLSDDEMELFLESWGELSKQFSDIIQTEQRQIDELIKLEILGNRIMRNIKILDAERDELITEVEKLRAKENFEMDEEFQQLDEYLINLISRISIVAQAISKDYQQNVDARRKIIDDLNGRRKDRANKLENVGSKFSDIVIGLQEEKVREVQGRQTELLKLAREKKMAEWRKINSFPDGSRECFLLDEHSEVRKHEFIEDPTDPDLLNNPTEEDINGIIGDNKDAKKNSSS